MPTRKSLVDLYLSIGMLSALILAAPACETGMVPMDPVTPTDPGNEQPGETPDPDPAPTDPGSPAHPTQLGLVKQAGFADYALRWTQPQTDDAVDAILLYASDAPFSNPGEATLLAELDPGETTFDVRIQPNSGLHHYRAAARYFDGAESDLSPAFIADSTQRLTFSAAKNRADTTEMFMTIPGQLEPTCISGSLAPFSLVGAPTWAPDGRKISFLSDRDRIGAIAVYVAGPNGDDEPVRVSEIGAIGDLIVNSLWTADASRVIYTRYNADTASTKSFSAPATGDAAPVELAPSISATGLVFAYDYLPLSNAVLMVTFAPVTFEPLAIHVVDLDSGDTRELIQFAPGEIEFLDSGVSPDETKFAFVSDRITPGIDELFVMPFDGSADPVPVSGPIIADGGVSYGRWSPDGSKIAFSAEKDDADTPELYIVAADGATDPVKLSGAVPKNWGVQNISFSPDGTKIAFTADKDVSTRVELYVATIAVGGEPPKVSGTPVGRGIRGYEWSPRSDQLAFFAEIDSTNVYNVYTTRADGVGTPRLESGTFVEGGTVSVVDFNYSTDGVFISFHGDKETDDVYDRFVTRVGSSVEPVSVTGAMVPGGSAKYGTGIWSTLGR